MKITWSVTIEERGRSRHEEIVLPEYYRVDEVIEDLRKIIDKHEKQAKDENCTE